MFEKYLTYDQSGYYYHRFIIYQQLNKEIATSYNIAGIKIKL